MRLTPLLLVGCGGFAGAVARYLVGVAVARVAGTAFPWATFVINVSGCFLIGFFLTLTTERVTVHEAWRFFLPVGFIGSYTTFSTYEWEILKLGEDAAWGRALGYVLASTLAGFAAVWLAAWTARRF